MLFVKDRPSTDRQIKRPALVLVGQPFYSNDKQQPGTWLNRLSASRENWTERIDLERPSWAEVVGNERQPGMLQQFFQTLHIEVVDGGDHAEVSTLVGQLVEGTQRNLASLRRLMTVLDEEIEHRQDETVSA